MDLTTKEKLNCKDYQSAKRAVEFWDKLDEEFVVGLIPEQDVIYLWRVGTVRFQVVRRVEWEKLEFSKLLRISKDK